MLVVAALHYPAKFAEYNLIVCLTGSSELIRMVMPGGRITTTLRTTSSWAFSSLRLLRGLEVGKQC
jgi:hypothetical protein